MDNNTEIKEIKKATFLHKLRLLRWSITGIVLGAIGGYVYYSQVGCSSGACTITSNPWLTVIWVGLLGYLIGNTFDTNKKKYKQKNEKEHGID